MPEPSTASPDPERERHSATLSERWQKLFPGLSVTVLIALASAFLSEHYGAPAMLLAILIGLALHFLAEDPKTAAGLDFASRTVLRIGIALLGLRVSVAMFAELGAAVIAMIVGAVLLTIVFGILASRLSGQGTAFGVLTGGAVAICGASAALAISATLGNRSKEADQQMVFTVIGVTMLSTLAMIFYPILASLAGLDDHQTGNARFLADRGAAYLLPQTELSPDRLAGILSSLDRGRLLNMAEHARALAKPLAAVAVAHVCAELAGGDAK